MTSIFDEFNDATGNNNPVAADFSQLPGGGAGPAKSYYDWIDPKGKGAKLTNTPAGPKPDPFEAAGFTIPKTRGAAKQSTELDPFESAGFSLPKEEAPETSRRRDTFSGASNDAPKKTGALTMPSEMGLETGQSIPATSFTERSKAITARARATPAGAPAAIATGAVAPYLLPLLAPVLSGLARTGGKVGAAWAAEKGLEAIVPDEYQPALIKALRAVGEAR